MIDRDETLEKNWKSASVVSISDRSKFLMRFFKFFWNILIIRLRLFLQIEMRRNV